MLDALLNCQTMGILLALAHEFDMPALTLRIKRLLLPPAGYLVDPTHGKPPADNCTDSMKVCISGTLLYWASVPVTSPLLRWSMQNQLEPLIVAATLDSTL